MVATLVHSNWIMLLRVCHLLLNLSHPVYFLDLNDTYACTAVEGDSSTPTRPLTPYTRISRPHGISPYRVSISLPRVYDILGTYLPTTCFTRTPRIPDDDPYILSTKGTNLFFDTALDNSVELTGKGADVSIAEPELLELATVSSDDGGLMDINPQEVHHILDYDSHTCIANVALMNTLNGIGSFHCPVNPVFSPLIAYISAEIPTSRRQYRADLSSIPLV
ncbi:hypothetical protein B0H11DRAFT_2221282 [Mycena galericulata]|nr:hypothetical protein B0H11DRAFT_2221282 [Mycena galericulata]